MFVKTTRKQQFYAGIILHLKLQIFPKFVHNLHPQTHYSHPTLSKCLFWVNCFGFWPRTFSLLVGAELKERRRHKRAVAALSLLSVGPAQLSRQLNWHRTRWSCWRRWPTTGPPSPSTTSSPSPSSPSSLSGSSPATGRRNL